MFTDDLKFFRTIDSFRSTFLIQFDLIWLYLNISKCSVISFSHKKDIELFAYKFNHFPFSQSDDIRDLGLPSRLIYTFRTIFIMLSPQLSIYLDLSTVWTFFKNIHTLKYLYINLVWSRLKYCSIIRSPYHYFCKQIESIQQSITIIMYDFCPISIYFLLKNIVKL